MVRQPNFFIVGAPRCGTSALRHYLRSHPAIFMPRDSREPHFFATDLESFRHIKSLDAYIALFAPATPHHVAIGEKSAYYLYSTCALKEILRFNNRAKVIALLRDPIELVYSYYYKVRWTLDEDQADFQTAWLLQSERQAGRRVPKGCRYPFKLQYHAVAALESQVQRLFELLPADQIKVVLFDDLVLSPRRVYDDVLTFLGVSSDNRCHFPPVNQNRTYRYAFFHRLMISPPQTVDRCWGICQWLAAPQTRWSLWPLPRAIVSMELY